MNQKINILFGFLFSLNFMYAQISERNLTPQKPTVNTTYSSELNFMHHDNLEEYKKYVGQEFFILPSNFGSYVSPSDKTMFDDMYYQTPKEISVEVPKGRKKIIEKRTIKHYLGDENDNFSYDNVGGKTFKVIDFDLSKSRTIIKDYNELHFTLVDKTTNEIVIWKPKLYEFRYPYNIMIVSHLDFLKNYYKNKKYYARRTMLNESEDSNSVYHKRIINLLNGQNTKVEEKSLWKVVDVSLVNVYTSSFKTPMIILSNFDNTVELPVYFLKEGPSRTTTRPSIYKDFMNSEDFEILVKKFGKDNAEAILANKVKVGMTDEMCKLSWGEPDKINKSISKNDYTEQWVYGNSYLYFSKGILRTIQN